MTDPLSPSSSAPGAGSAGAPRGRAALWVSAFRPFYLLAAVYLVWVILTGAAAWSGFVRSGPGTLPLPGGVALWHGHEMLFGFAMAVVTGTVLTALPSWAGTPEVRDRQLALLAGLWFAGRLGFHVVGLWGPGIATLVAAIVDTALPLALLVLLTPQLTRCADRRYALLLPVLAVLAMANLVFHAAVAGLDAVGAATALRAALWALIVLYSLKGGVLTPTFTGNALVASGRGMAPTCRPAHPRGPGRRRCRRRTAGSHRTAGLGRVHRASVARGALAGLAGARRTPGHGHEPRLSLAARGTGPAQRCGHGRTIS